eukprot:351943-Chlamydomonas_euryale.AAC.7
MAGSVMWRWEAGAKVMECVAWHDLVQGASMWRQRSTASATQRNTVTAHLTRRVNEPNTPRSCRQEGQEHRPVLLSEANKDGKPPLKILPFNRCNAMPSKQPPPPPHTHAFFPTHKHAHTHTPVPRPPPPAPAAAAPSTCSKRPPPPRAARPDTAAAPAPPTVRRHTPP